MHSPRLPPVLAPPAPSALPLTETASLPPARSDLPLPKTASFARTRILLPPLTKPPCSLFLRSRTEAHANAPNYLAETGANTPPPLFFLRPKFGLLGLICNSAGDRNLFRKCRA